MSLLLLLNAEAQSAALSVSGIIIPERSTEEGILVKSTSLFWAEIVEVLGNDWSVAYQIAAEKWEEIVAGAFNKAQYEVTLTPRSGDHGRDVIAIKRGGRVRKDHRLGETVRPGQSCWL